MIRLILIDGDPEGLRLASIAGRTTVVVACPWTQIRTLLARDEAKRPAVYFMVGSPLESPTSHAHDQAIYIGECDALADRFSSRHHKADTAEWSQIFLATTSEGTFNKAHARLAEFRLRERAHEAKRADVLTKAASTGKIDEGDAAFTEEFVRNVIVLAQTLGLVLFRPPVSKKPVVAALVDGASPSDSAHAYVENAFPMSAGEQDCFYFDYTKTEKISARMVLDGAEFVITRGSEARAADGEGLSPGLLEKRRAARQSGILVPSSNPALEQFASDYPTSSVSAAGSMVYGSACAGPVAWRHVGTGLLYKDWLTNQTVVEDA